MSWRDVWEVRRRARAIAAPGMDATPKDEVDREGKWVVRHVRPAPDAPPPSPAADPVLLVPPLMVRPLVFDLQPDHSFVATLRDRGLPTYVLDFGVPERANGALRLEDYVLGALPAAAAAVRRHAGSERLSLVGYCLGGLFCLLHAAADGVEPPARIVTIGSPIDGSQMGVVGMLGAAAAGRLDPVIDALGVIPGWMANAGFQILSGRRAIERLFELRQHEADEAYLRSWGSISRWLSGLVPYPGEAFKQVLGGVMARNRGHDPRLRLGDQRLDLGAVSCPVLAFAGRTDAVVPVAAVVALRRHLPPGKVSVRVVPGGHVGILGGAEAPREVWGPTAKFLLGEGDDATSRR